MTLASLGTTDLQDCSLQSSHLAIYMFRLVAFFTLRVGENRVANLATVYMVMLNDIARIVLFRSRPC